MYISTSSVFLIILITGLFCSCIKHKPTDPLTFSGKTIIVGSGGGFAGIEQEYRLLNNGQLYYRSSIRDSFKLVEAKSKGKARKWAVRFDSLQLEKVAFNEPGNIYKFVGYKTDSVENRIVWSNVNSVPNSAIPDFYKNFLAYWGNKKKQD